MVYKRYIRRNGKLVGPYYYKTVKEKNGKTRTIYIGRTVPAAVKEEKTTLFYESKVSQLKENIQLCDAKKELLRINLNKLLSRYQNKEISYGQYELLKNKYLRGKTPEYWYDYYDLYKGEIQDQIRKYSFASSCLEYIKTVSDAGKELEKAGEEKQKIPQAFQEKILQLQNNAIVCEQRKIQLRKRLQGYKQRYDSNLIKYSQYELLKNSYLKGKTPEYWFSYYDNQKLDLQEQINKYKVSSTCEGYAAEIFEAKPLLKDKVLTEIVKEDLELEEPKFYDKNKSLTQIVSVLIIALILIPSLLLTAPMINSFFSKEQPLDLTNLEFSVVKGVSVVKGFVDETVVTNLPKKQEREQQELKKSYEKEVEKPEEKAVEEQQTPEQEPNIISKIIQPITEFFGVTTPTTFAITEENITIPYTILPEENMITPSENVIQPEENITLPEENVTIPEENITIPEENITIPEENITLPEENITLPEENITLPEENITIPPENITLPEENITIPEEDFTDFIPAKEVYDVLNVPEFPPYVKTMEQFCAEMNSITRGNDFGAEITFEMPNISVSYAEICAYQTLIFPPETIPDDFVVKNYIEPVDSPFTKKTSVANPKSDWASVDVTKEKGWKCADVTNALTTAIVSNSSSFQLRWWGNDLEKKASLPYICFKGPQTVLQECEGNNPSGTNDCRPYLRIIKK